MSNKTLDRLWAEYDDASTATGVRNARKAIVDEVEREWREALAVLAIAELGGVILRTSTNAEGAGLGTRCAAALELHLFLEQRDGE